MHANRKIENASIGYNNKRIEDVRQQYDRVLQAKRKLEIQSTHQERLKRITKNSDELDNINAKLSTMRANFLDFSVKNL
ncbi:AC29-like protein [Orgyia pseudotsugata single capsid nuclopolyhedrovirus]|nr:AC29-like protein [Orgyia pseudotsugata single capsid nuclopolyhedrovirus]